MLTGLLLLLMMAAAAGAQEATTSEAATSTTAPATSSTESAYFTRVANETALGLQFYGPGRFALRSSPNQPLRAAFDDALAEHVPIMAAKVR